MRYAGHSISQIGNLRTDSQDVVAIDQALGVYILCDGMGGTARGDVAADIASKTCLQFIKQHSNTLSRVAKGDLPSLHLSDLAQSAVQAANHAVYTYSQEHSESRGSGTTVALLITAGTSGACAHVGDSRVYAFRNNQLFQLTKDHSLAQDLIDQGVLDRKNLATFAFKHVLSRAVGLLPAVSVDTLHFDIIPGDKFLLTSDGISSTLSSTNVEEAMTISDPQKLLERLISQARAAHQEEDLSVITVEASAEASEQQAHIDRSAELSLKTTVLQEVFLFKALAPQNILRIVNASTVVSFKKGEVVVSQGEVDTSLFIILDGSFDIEIDGHQISAISRGNHFGEMAFLTSHPRSATVRAATDGKVLKIAADDFRAFIQAHPQDGVNMITALARELSDRLRQTNQFLAQR